jgi:methylamine dehydrogenase accessory protein MauD
MWLLLIVLSFVVVALARQIGTLHLRLGPRGALEIDTEGPPLDESPEPAELADLMGRRVAIAGPGRPQLLLFVSPGCMVCEQVLPSLGAVANAGELSPVVLTDVDAHETARSYARKTIDAPIVPAPEIVQAYDVPGTPYAVIIDRLGVVRAKGTVNNLEQLEGLIDTARRRAIEAVPEAI